MKKQISRRAKKTLAILLLVSFAVSLTAASVSAGASEKTQVAQEKSACKTETLKNKAYAGSVKEQATMKAMATKENMGNCAKSRKIFAGVCCSEYGPGYTCELGACKNGVCQTNCVGVNNRICCPSGYCQGACVNGACEGQCNPDL